MMFFNSPGAESRIKDLAVKYILMGAASSSIIIVALIFLFLGKEALPFAFEPGIPALLNDRWAPVSFEYESFGIYPLLSGTLIVTLFSMVIAVPVGVLGAAYISEIAHETEKEILKPFIELLAGIPSVVIGFFGLVVLSPIVKSLFNLNTGLNVLTGSLLLAMMSIPTIISISEDAIRAVPTSYKEASFALGAGRINTLRRVTIPAAISGIMAAVLLGMGRVIGETMAVMMVTGNAANITISPLKSARTMTATIAAEMGEVPFGSEHYRALFWVGIILLVLTFSLVLLSRRVMKQYGNR